MVDFIASFVTLSKENKFRYISHKMSGHRYPAHTREDIVGMCELMNRVSDHDVKYVDVFCVLDDYGNIVWEEESQQPLTIEEEVQYNAVA
jgi:hypothetical protein